MVQFTVLAVKLRDAWGMPLAHKRSCVRTHSARYSHGNSQNCNVLPSHTTVLVVVVNVAVTVPVTTSAAAVVHQTPAKNSINPMRNVVLIPACMDACTAVCAVRLRAPLIR